MKSKYRKPEQIVRLLRQGKAKLAEGQSLDEMCRQLGISDSTFYYWRKQYGKMGLEQIKRFKELQKENTRLKKLVADQALYEDDPRVFGYFQGSEPSESDLEYWAGYHWKCHWAAPSKPSWTDVQSINYGVSRSYIETFIEMFNPEILVFDFYQWYWWWKTLIENLEYFRKQAIANDIYLYSWVEVDADSSGGETNRRRYHYSVYMNLTYGAKGICWFTASKIFNKSNGTIANQGYYDDVQAMNVEINNLGPELLGLTSTAVYHTGMGTEAKDWTGAADPMNPIPFDNWVQIVEAGFGLGMFENAAGDDYVMVMNRDIDAASRTVMVQFKTEVSQVRIFDATAGTWSTMSISGSAPNQQVSFSTGAGSGKLLSVTKASP